MSTYETCLRASGAFHFLFEIILGYRRRFIVLAPKKYDIVGAAPIAYGQSHLGIKCNDTVLVCYVGNIKHRKHGANQNYDRRIDGWWRWPGRGGGGQRSGELGI